MAAALQPVSPFAAHTAVDAWPALLLAALIATPVLWVALSAIGSALDAAAWQALWSEPQLPRALALSLWTGLAATALSAAVAAWLLSISFPGRGWRALVRVLPPMLAVPHAAFAIGLAFLIAPSGWILRLFSPWATGFAAPPPWPTVQDPWGLGLIAVLVFKEVPFLLWAAATQLQRADTAARWEAELQLALSMGYSPRTAWWQVVWPQLWPMLVAPLAAVLAYSLTVVDMALAIGPVSPPTLAVLAWQWLLDADASVNATGAAAGWLLAGVLALVAAVLWLAQRLLRQRRPRVNGRRGHSMPVGWRRSWPAIAVAATYGAVLAALAVGSVSGVWPFPKLWPDNLSLQAWQSVASSSSTLQVTVALAAASSLAALAWSVAWLECAPPAWDRSLRRLVYLPLLLPSVLWVVGLHRVGLAWGIDAHWTGLWLAHSLAAAPYVLIALSPAYLGFDPRYRQLTASLGSTRLSYLLRVKWPLLKASLWAGAAVGFAVSVAQYLPTLFVGAGRYATVTTEAVTLASGGQRSLTAAYAWLQALLPALAFAIAAWAGRPRRFRDRTVSQ